MKEYEFIVNAIEEDLCDRLVSVICRENYEDRKYEDGFRRIFDEYGKLHKLYLEEKDDIRRDGSLYIYKEKWKNNCTQRLEMFIKDLKKENNGLDISALADTYLDKLKKEEISTIDKRVFIYPYLTEEMQRHNSAERKCDHGKEV